LLIYNIQKMRLPKTIKKKADKETVPIIIRTAKIRRKEPIIEQKEEPIKEIIAEQKAEPIKEERVKGRKFKL
jgi:hypothetical protein